MPNKFTIELDARELATVIAALYCWGDDEVAEADFAGPEMLRDDDEIDDLIERINAASAPKVTA